MSKKKNESKEAKEKNSREEGNLDVSATGGEELGSAGHPAAAETALPAKNFRLHPEIENFYRFIYENDLRCEALGIINQIQEEKRNRQKLKAPLKAKVH